jgi:23S rRNA (uracil1939-C5)-methyltransferase
MPRPPTLPRLDLGVVETSIERIVPGGYGLGHLTGRTLFVSGAAPGDKVRVRADKVKGAVAWGRVVEVLEAGPDRVTPLFPDVAACGVADFAHLRYAGQLAAKAAIVRDALKRIGGIDAPEDLAVRPSPEQWGYRMRAEWRHDPAAPAFGFHAAGSRAVCDVPTDPFVGAELAAAFADLRAAALAGELPADLLELRAGAAGGVVSLDPDPSGDPPRTIVARVAGEDLAHDARAFFQPNAVMLEPLVAEALRFAEAPDDGEGLAIDLFCGVGLFTLPLARRFRRVIGVEADGHAAAFAQANADRAGLANVRIAPQPVEAWLAGAYRSHGRPPFLLLDPPRVGLESAALHGILRLKPTRIAYVSCDPATLARDLKALLAAGYELDDLAALDLFPQTHHVEVVAHLVRGEEPERATPVA